MTLQKIYTGTSSIRNPTWQPLFFPEGLPSSKWFEYYCEYFNTYEINASFYKFPTVRTLQNWYRKSPPGFLFAVKAPKVITHTKKFIDVADELDELYAVCAEGLKEKLKCVLFQCPPSFSYSEERLEIILASLDYDHNNVVEFRHESWWRPDVFASFSAHGITFCSVSYPLLPNEIVSTTRLGYLRLHGVPNLFYSGYDEQQLSHYLLEISNRDDVKEFFVYFNNTAGIEGIKDALLFKELVSK
ncbi:MAG TPA: DUF72 domain-containing protein [Flavobacterium sp.]|jgi:uncharacterized protein YecE (DUF72 family)